MDPKEQAKFDQVLAELADNIPPMLRRFYEALIHEGFTESDAMSLTRAYVHGLVGGKLA